jgi:hypothetical protein
MNTDYRHLKVDERVFIQLALRSDEIHRDIGVDEDHRRSATPYPCSISASIVSISAVG